MEATAVEIILVFPMLPPTLYSPLLLCSGVQVPGLDERPLPMRGAGNTHLSLVTLLQYWPLFGLIIIDL